MLLGYARGCTDDQNLELQREALKAAGCARLFEDRFGARDRPGFTLLLEVARSGDIVAVWRLDRLARSLKDLIAVVERLEAAGVGLKSLHEPLDTTARGGKQVFHLFGALAEFERALDREGSRARPTPARMPGRHGGRPRLLDEDQRALALRLHRERQHPIADICRMMGISKSTLYSYLDEAQRHAGAQG
jgi:DNA invertase Pin-like site-specific DNA recombinase